MDTLTGYGHALTHFSVNSLTASAPDSGHAPTFCTDWDVRRLVNQLVIEQLVCAAGVLCLVTRDEPRYDKAHEHSEGK